MKPNVFISYKSEEYCYADKVRFALEQSGVACWMAPESIQGGASYAASIPKAIRECSVFVLILTEKSQASQWVQRELDRAINEGRRIMPFVPEKMMFNDDVTFYLTNVQMYFAYQDWDRELDHMIDDICAVLGVERLHPAPPQPAPPVEEPPAAPPAKKAAAKKPAAQRSKPKKKRKLPLLIALGALAGLAAAIVITLAVTMNAGVDICGEHFSLSDKSLTLKDKTILAEDVANIGKLEGLQTLDLENCTFDEGVESLGELQTAQLYSLTISSCGLTTELLNTLPLEDVSLMRLDLSDNPLLNSLDCLNGCNANLRNLNVSNIGVVDTDAVAACEKLTELLADDDSLTDLGSIGQLQKLETLSVRDNQLTTLNGLEGCIYLEQIDAAGNRLTDISGLKNATLLVSVNLNNNALTSLDALENSAGSLKNLCARNNQLEDSAFFGKLKSAEFLSLSGNALTDLSPLDGISTLKGIDAARNKVKEWDLASLTGKLQYVDVSDNGMESLTGTLQFDDSDAICLNLSGNGMREVTLNQGAAIDLVDLHDTQLANYETFYRCKSIHVLVVDYDENLDFEKLKDLVHNKLYLIDCPLDKQVGISDILGSYVIYLTSEEYRAQADEMTPEKLAYYSTSKDKIARILGLETGSE